jgi:hypothetical protein
VLDVSIGDESSDLIGPGGIVHDFLKVLCHLIKCHLSIIDLIVIVVLVLDLHGVKVVQLLIFEEVDLLLHLEVGRDGSANDGELKGEPADLIELELSVDLLCDFGHVLKVEDVPETLNDCLQIVGIIIIVLRVVILLQELEEKLSDLIRRHHGKVLSRKSLSLQDGQVTLD